MDGDVRAAGLPDWARPPGNIELPDALLAQARAGLSILGTPPPLPPRPRSGTTLRGHLTVAPVATLLAWCATDALTDTTWTLARWVCEAVKAAREAGLEGEMGSAIYNGCLAVRSLHTNGCSDLDALLQDVRTSKSLGTAHACICSARRTAAEPMVRELDRLERLLAFATRIRTPHPDTAPSSDDRRGLPQPSSPAPEPVDSGRKEAPCRLPRATPTDIAAIRSHVQDLDFARSATLQAYDWECLLDGMAQASLSVRAVVGAVLSSGFNRADLTKCQVIASVSAAPSDADVPCYALAENAWLVRNAVNPLYKDGSDRDAARWIALPVQAWGRGAANLEAVASRRVGRSLFKGDELAEASLHMRRLRDSRGCSVTLGRIAAAVVQAIRDLSGDRSAAACIFGFHASAQARSPWHYRQVGVDWIQDLHASAVARVQLALGCTGPRRRLEHPAIQSQLIGSHRVPNPQAVATWAVSARASIQTAPRGRPALSKIAVFHNDFLCYTLQVLLWATGVRPTEEGLASLVPHGALLFADEKRKRHRAVRALPLSPIAARQWSLYQRHRAWVADRYHVPKAVWFTLELDATGVMVGRPLDVARLSRMSGSPFEDNAHRHALATGLLERGWSTHRINLWLGHAGLGEEPGAPHSAHEPHFGAEELADVDAVLTAHGWQVCEGLGRG